MFTHEQLHAAAKQCGNMAKFYKVFSDARTGLTELASTLASIEHYNNLAQEGQKKVAALEADYEERKGIIEDEIEALKVKLVEDRSAMLDEVNETRKGLQRDVNLWRQKSQEAKVEHNNLLGKIAEEMQAVQEEYRDKKALVTKIDDWLAGRK
jgi:hypothetical protein